MIEVLCADDPFRAHLPMSFGLGLVNPVTFDYVAWPVGYIVSLYNSGVRALQIGIRAGLPVGNPFYWSMLSLELGKIIYNLKIEL